MKKYTVKTLAEAKDILASQNRQWDRTLRLEGLGHIFSPIVYFMRGNADTGYYIADTQTLVVFDTPRPWSAESLKIESKNTSDHDSMLAIQGQMDGVEWNSFTLDRICDILKEAGYRVRDIDDKD